MSSKNNTATTTSSANPTAQQAYLGLLGQVQQTAQTPYQAYTGELVPGVNAQQTTGINSINQNANYAQPFIGQAAGLATQAATPLTAAQIQQYQSPYTQSVVNATQAQFNNQNQQQQQQVTGNAIAQGALGGNRTAVAQSELANQQQLAQAPDISGLENQGYQTGLNTALSQQQAQAQGAYSLGNLGVSGQNAALTGANAQVGAGNLQYGVSSAQDQAAYQQFLNQQAFPYQQLQWASGLESGLGSNLGGTSTTTSPGPSVWSQILGLGEAAAGTAGKFATSGATAGAARGGRIHGYAVGGTPYSGGLGYIPQPMQISRGRGIPSPPGIGGQGGQSGGAGGGLSGAGGSFGDLGVAAKNLYNGYNSNGTASGDQWVQAGQGQGVYAPIDTPDDYVGGIGRAYRGGRIGYDDGGSVNLVVPNGDYTPDNRMNLGLASGFNYATALSPEIMQQYTADMAHKYGPQWRQMRAPAMTAYSKGYAAGGTPDPAGVDDPDSAYNLGLAPNNDFIDARIPEGPGGYGRNVTPDWDSHQNDTLAAVKRAQTTGVIQPPQDNDGQAAISSAIHAPTGVAPTHAMAFTTDGTDQSPDYVRDRNNDTAPSSDLTYQHPKTDIWGGLIAAGLGTMASRSPFVGTAIGEGGLAGLREYSAEQAQNISEAEKKTNFAQQNKRIDLESTRLDQAAKQAQDRLNLETRTQNFNEMKPFPAGQTIGPLGLPITTYQRLDPASGKVVPAQGAPQGTADGSAPVSPILDPDSRKVIADQYIAGDHTALSGLGFGNIGAVNRGAVWSEISSKLKASGATGTDLAAAKANFMAESAGARTAAVRGANIDMSIQEAQQTFPLALEASAALPRTDYVPWNKAVQMVQAGTSSPQLARYVTANQAVITAYAQAMSRANVTSDHSRMRAEELLSTATSPEAYQAVLDQMGKEMHAAQLAPDAVRKDIESRITGRPAATSAPATPAVNATTPKIGEEKQFKQGIGVWNGTTWVPKGQP